MLHPHAIHSAGAGAGAGADETRPAELSRTHVASLTIWTAFPTAQNYSSRQLSIGNLKTGNLLSHREVRIPLSVIQWPNSVVMHRAKNLLLSGSWLHDDKGVHNTVANRIRQRLVLTLRHYYRLLSTQLNAHDTTPSRLNSTPLESASAVWVQGITLYFKV